MTAGPARWFTTAAEDRNGTTAALVIVPGSQDHYAAALRPLRRNGWTQPSRNECDKGAWTVAPGSVLDLVDNAIVRVGAPTAQFFPRGPIDTPPVWRSAARERRALVALAPPGSFPNSEDHTPEEFGKLLVNLAGQRLLATALVTVRFNEFSGPWPKGWR